MDDEYEDEDQWEEGAEDILEKGLSSGNISHLGILKHALVCTDFYHHFVFAVWTLWHQQNLYNNDFVLSSFTYMFLLSHKNVSIDQNLLFSG